MGSTFREDRRTTYNAASIRWFAPSTKQSEAAIRFGGAKGVEVPVFVDDTTITRLLDHLVERNILIDLSPPASPEAR